MDRRTIDPNSTTYHSFSFIGLDRVWTHVLSAKFGTNVSDIHYSLLFIELVFHFHFQNWYLLKILVTINITYVRLFDLPYK